jgi:glycosyltransferase involved in cell wall biosynthesis
MRVHAQSAPGRSAGELQPQLKPVARSGIWIGMAELGNEECVIEAAGPPRPHQQMARILIRIHGAPIGYVSLPLQPVATLAARVKEAAESSMAEAFEHHLRLDGAATSTWEAQVGCPKRFRPTADAAGVSIVVCTRDRPELLQECLQALLLVDYAPLEIIVVDNAPTADLTKKIVIELADSDPRVRYTCEPLPGTSRARNHGLAVARFDLVAFADDDVIVDPGWPAALAAGFAADPEVACITGLVASRSVDTGAEFYFDSRYQWGESFQPRRYDLGKHRDSSPIYPFATGVFGTGANFAVRRAEIKRLGGFDPVLGGGSPCRGGEDLDLFVRVILSGGRLCYLPTAVVWHRHRTDESALAEQVYSYGYGLGAYLAKRIVRREITIVTIVHGLSRFIFLANRMRSATKASQFKGRGLRLAVQETWGILAGALRYIRVALRSRFAG